MLPSRGVLTVVILNITGVRTKITDRSKVALCQHLVSHRTDSTTWTRRVTFTYFQPSHILTNLNCLCFCHVSNRILSHFQRHLKHPLLHARRDWHFQDLHWLCCHRADRGCDVLRNEDDTGFTLNQVQRQTHVLNTHEAAAGDSVTASAS